MVQGEGFEPPMKDAGIPAAAVVEIIGHDSEQMSQHYTHTGREALERVAASLADLVCGSCLL